ncbi:MAG: phosphoadenosine phosphosulfate reductase family protein [Desulfamplus sp.]|nr:phosphoadenosine phosphosulfate reductase family protein [Desulfamplus sp.]
MPVLVSFSGGKDSTVVSHLVMNALGRSDILHIFADTTIEFPDTYRYINDFQQQHPLTPFITSRSQLDFFETAKSIGPPSRILRWCCTTHKTNPLSKIINSLSPNKGVLTFDGVRKSESSRRSEYPRISNQHKIAREILARPILDWSDLQVWIYLRFHDLNFNKAYKRGFRRVGCLYCPFNSDWSYEITKKCYPKKYERWQNFLMEQALRMAHPNPENFVDKGWRARAGGRGLDYYKTSIESAPCLLSDTALSYQLLSGDIKNVNYFLSPFGNQTWIRKNDYSEVFFIHDYQTNELLASVEVGFQDNAIRINYLLEKNRLLFRQRVEKQIKKIQSCFYCGACGAKCTVKALDINQGSYKIDNSKCISCLTCVSHDCPAVKSLHYKGSK